MTNDSLVIVVYNIQLYTSGRDLQTFGCGPRATKGIKPAILSGTMRNERRFDEDRRGSRKLQGVKRRRLGSICRMSRQRPAAG